MTNWYDMPGALDGFENNPDFLEKIDNDDLNSCPKVSDSTTKTKYNTENAWLKKRNYKKRMVRRFLSMNPALDYSKLSGMKCESAIYVNYPHYSDGTFHDARMEYVFNPYTKIFLSERGDLRKYYGNVSPARSGSYSLFGKDKLTAKLTNRRIRALDPHEDHAGNHSYYKKAFGPMVDDLW